MKYWWDFVSQDGFNHGRNIPLDAHESREVTVRLVNAIAKQLGSNVRFVPYEDTRNENAVGDYNPVRILICSAKWYDEVYSPHQSATYWDCFESPDVEPQDMLWELDEVFDELEMTEEQRKALLEDKEVFPELADDKMTQALNLASGFNAGIYLEIKVFLDKEVYTGIDNYINSLKLEQKND